MPTGQSERAIHVSGLGKRFGARWVLRGVTFEVSGGEAVALLGANGTGKSTILRILATLLRPSAGSAAVRGFDTVRHSSLVRADVGYLAHTAGVYGDLTARENLRFAADMLGAPQARVEPALHRVGLGAVRDERVRGFSAGMQRRLSIARLSLRAPRVLLLDEPYSNLDTDGVELMSSLIRDVVAAGGAALIALHELAPARDIVRRSLRLADGRIAAEAGAVPLDSGAAAVA